MDAKTTKLLIVANNYFPDEPGGAEISTRNLVECINASRNFDVSVLTLSEFTSCDIVNGVRVYRIKRRVINSKIGFINRLFGHYLDLWGYSEEIERLLSEISPDVINTHNLKGMSAVWTVAKKLSIPVVHTIRDNYFFSQGSDSSSFISRFYLNLVCAVRVRNARHVARFVSISNYFSNLNSSVLDSNVACIYNGFPDEELSQRASFETTKPTVVNFGYLGRITREKGVHLLLESFSEKNHLNSRLLIGGVGPDYKALKSEYGSRDNSNVFFYGKVCAAKFLSEIDFLVVPSLWEEAFGRVLVEAHLSGCRVIASNRGAIPEILELTSTSYHIFDPDLKGSLGETIDALINVDSLPVCYVKDTIENFSNKTMVDKYISLYEEVMECT